MTVYFHFLHFWLFGVLNLPSQHSSKKLGFSSLREYAKPPANPQVSQACSNWLGAFTMPDRNTHRQVLSMKERVYPLDTSGGLIQGQIRNRDVLVHQGVVHRSHLPFSFCSISRQQATAQWFPSDLPHLLIKLAFPL